MKRLFLFTLLFLLLISSNVFSIDVPVVIPTPKPNIQNTIRPSMVTSLQVYVTDSEIVINFDSSLGISFLSLTDESGRLVYQETVNVTSGLIYYLPIDLPENGNYLLTIFGYNGSMIGTYP